MPRFKSSILADRAIFIHAVSVSYDEFDMQKPDISFYSGFLTLPAVAEEGISGTGGTLRRDFFKEEYQLNNAIGEIIFLPL